MALRAGVHLGPYEIVGPLGAGGMGEVYRARDTRLDRTVAIKVLASRSGESPELRRRFEREARAISALSHPHICVLHDVGQWEDVGFLVMEYLEGETVAARIEKGALPIDQVLRYGFEVADALGQAHRRGIIHRDLKPGNIMLTKAGVKLLDFGLAKLTLLDANAAASELSSLRTSETPLTTRGTLVGTLPYMAPELLEGREPDSRVDLFALGAVLHEMITGQRAFGGHTPAAVAAAILTAEPPLASTLRPGAPPALDRLVRSCLEKDPDERWQNAHDLAQQLRWAADPQGSIVGPTRKVEAWPAGLAWIAAATVAAFAGLALGWIAAQPKQPVTTRQQVRFDVRAPDGEAFTDSTMAVSPAGDRIAFSASADGDDQLYVRALDSGTPTRIPGTEGGYTPFWSPDGSQIVFAAGGQIKKVDLSSGRVHILCDDGRGQFNGGSWSPGGTIIVAIAGDLFGLPTGGGKPSQLGERAEGESRRNWPQFLPDGRHYLYQSIGTERQGVYVAALGSDERRLLVRTDYNAAYSSGHLLYVRDGVLVAQAFDVQSLQLSGDAITLSSRVGLYGSGRLGRVASEAAFSVSPGGTLAWRPGLPRPDTSLTWFDREGRSLGTLGGPAGYVNSALSPDDGKLAVDVLDAETQRRDIWIFDLVRGGRTRLTNNPADDFGPTWSSDGTRIIYSSDRSGERGIYTRLANGSGSDELLLESRDRGANVEDAALDGSFLAFNWMRAGDTDIFVLPLRSGQPGKPVPISNTEFFEDMSQFSPDHRFLAYRSQESDRSEVYVRNLSDDGSPGTGKWQVSTDGGSEPRWRRDGRELFYVSGPAATAGRGLGTIMAVSVKTEGAAFEAGVPKPLFEVQLPSFRRNRYVVTRDGRRFLVNVSHPTATGAIQPMEVIVNWLP